jgi:hypothetical protein
MSHNSQTQLRKFKKHYSSKNFQWEINPSSHLNFHKNLHFRISPDNHATEKGKKLLCMHIFFRGYAILRNILLIYKFITGSTTFDLHLCRREKYYKINKKRKNIFFLMRERNEGKKLKYFMRKKRVEWKKMWVCIKTFKHLGWPFYRYNFCDSRCVSQ